MDSQGGPNPVFGLPGTFDLFSVFRGRIWQTGFRNEGIQVQSGSLYGDPPVLGLPGAGGHIGRVPESGRKCAGIHAFWLSASGAVPAFWKILDHSSPGVFSEPGSGMHAAGSQSGKFRCGRHSFKYAGGPSGLAGLPASELDKENCFLWQENINILL